MAIAIDQQHCVACGCCSDTCPEGALELNDIAVVYEVHCAECLTCLDMCPTRAITESD